jgi:hypothetical protein
MSGTFDLADISHTEIWLFVDGERLSELSGFDTTQVKIRFDDACEHHPRADIEVREERHFIERRTLHMMDREQMTDTEDNGSHPVGCPVSSPSGAGRELVGALREWADVTAATDTEAQRQEDRLLEAWNAFKSSAAALANIPDGWREIDELAKTGEPMLVLFDGTGGREAVTASWTYDGTSMWWWKAAMDGGFINPAFVTHYREIGPLPQPPEVK